MKHAFLKLSLGFMALLLPLSKAMAAKGIVKSVSSQQSSGTTIQISVDGAPALSINSAVIEWREGQDILGEISDGAAKGQASELTLVLTDSSGSPGFYELIQAAAAQANGSPQTDSPAAAGSANPTTHTVLVQVLGTGGKVTAGYSFANAFISEVTLRYRPGNNKSPVVPGSSNSTGGISASAVSVDGLEHSHEMIVVFSATGIESATGPAAQPPNGEIGSWLPPIFTLTLQGAQNSCSQP